MTTSGDCRRCLISRWRQRTASLPASTSNRCCGGQVPPDTTDALPIVLSVLSRRPHYSATLTGRGTGDCCKDRACSAQLCCAAPETLEAGVSGVFCSDNHYYCAAQFTDCCDAAALLVSIAALKCTSTVRIATSAATELGFIGGLMDRRRVSCRPVEQVAANRQRPAAGAGRPTGCP